MPGDLTTTSNALSAAASGGAVIAIAALLASEASASLQKTVSFDCGKRERSAASAALPSRPKPQTATRRSARSARRIDQRREPRRNAMLAVRHEQRREREIVRIERRQYFVGEARDDRILAPLGTRRERRH